MSMRRQRGQKASVLLPPTPAGELCERNATEIETQVLSELQFRIIAINVDSLVGL